MGEKGAKLTSQASEAAENIKNKLAKIGEIRIKKMFGGFGVFEEDKMFALIDSKGKVFFKIDNKNRSNYEEAGSTKHGKMPYFSVPDKILLDEDLLQKWAQLSIEISKG